MIKGKVEVGDLVTNPSDLSFYVVTKVDEKVFEEYDFERGIISREQIGMPAPPMLHLVMKLDKTGQLAKVPIENYTSAANCIRIDEEFIAKEEQVHKTRIAGYQKLIDWKNDNKYWSKI